MSERIGFIGLGIMGQGMTRNLLKTGFPLTVWNRTASKTGALAELGAQVAASPADLAAVSDIIVICVSDTPDVEEVLLGDEGVILAVQPGALVVDCSTISPIRTKVFAQRLAEQGVQMLDAPISGGSEGAAKGTLSIMVGGAEESFQRALPVLEAMGKTITHVGGNGDGQMVKLVNQILVANSMLALGEAFLFAQAGGLDLEKTLQAVAGGAAGSWTLSNRGPQVAADALGVPVFGMSTAFHLYRTLQSRGMGTDGNHALIKALEYLADIRVGEATE